MRDELKSPKVENVAVAVVEDQGEDDEAVYNVYLLNLKEEIMEGIIVTSRGYGQNVLTGEQVKTSTLRHTIEVLLPNEAAKIEPITEEVLGLSNEYWVSFWVEEQLYDKKFVFLPETIQPQKLKTIPLLGAKGIMIK
ncbi:MAG: hypothetical protein EP338_07750 [Bacteroidetes bacterium]|nr:MAG: hypothetical protein EP338_07750 [Bacteroidota bacterium]